MTIPTRKAVEAARRVNLKHGQARAGQWTLEYSTWASMRQRCLNPANEAYARYGGRGITICPAWATFVRFFADMGLRPSRAHSIERRDNDKGYDPANCCWGTKTEQSRNRRGRQRLTINGQTHGLVEWAEQSGLSIGRIWKRLDSGWDPQRAVFAPPRSRAGLTHCKAGHLYTPETVRWVNHGRARCCLICRRAYIQQWNATQKGAA